MRVTAVRHWCLGDANSSANAAVRKLARQTEIPGLRTSRFVGNSEREANESSDGSPVLGLHHPRGSPDLACWHDVGRSGFGTRCIGDQRLDSVSLLPSKLK